MKRFSKSKKNFKKYERKMMARQVRQVSKRCCKKRGIE